MTSLADNLPPEFAAMVHPDWRKNEADYWMVREQLLEKYQGQWIGFADGVVIASGKTAVNVGDSAQEIAPHPFVTCVGREHEPERIRGSSLRWPTANKEPEMKSLADLLPPEIAAQLHPDLLKNEAEYWSKRDKLLEQYEGQWIAFADGAVIASAETAVVVGHDSRLTGRHPHVTCVGHEFEPERIRRTTYSYDTSRRRQPMPIVKVEFRILSGSPGVVLGDVIPDTGADASTLPWQDCVNLQLDPTQGRLGVLGGISAGFVGTVVFDIWAFLDDKEYNCRIHGNLSGTERILGRDVLNQLEILFRGPANEVVVNP